VQCRMDFPVCVLSPLGEHRPDPATIVLRGAKKAFAASGNFLSKEITWQTRQARDCVNSVICNMAGQRDNKDDDGGDNCNTYLINCYN
jgi:hypothetical protein